MSDDFQTEKPLSGPSSTNDPANADSGPAALIIAAAIVVSLMLGASAAASSVTGLIIHILASETTSGQSLGGSSGSPAGEYWYPIR